MRRIYLDHAATTPLRPEVLEAMRPWLEQEYGNPSSLHAEGRAAKHAIDRAREIISDSLNALFAEVIFTGSGTEAANMAIIGAALANEDPRRNRVLLGSAEHHCVLETAPMLQRLGYSVELIPVNRFAQVTLESLMPLLDEDVLLVAVMHANNELGTINPAKELCALAHEKGALFFCDTVQTYPHMNPSEIGADLLSISAHKIGGPKGLGALYIRAGTKIQPLIQGGGQERELRAGTENVAAIVGFGAAVSTYSLGSKQAARDSFLQILYPGFIRSNPDTAQTLPGHAHMRLPGISAETMLIKLDMLGVSASSGAACSSGSLEPSHVLLACGYSQVEAKEGLRFTFGRETSIDDAIEAAERVNNAASANHNRQS
jgi:cysteine desulfurase